MSDRKIRTIALVIVFLMVGCAVIYSFFSKQNKSLSPKVVVFGDSIIGNDQSEESVTSVLSELLGEEVFNAGVGGSKMSAGNPSISYMDNYNMVELADAIDKDKFDVLVAKLPREYLKLYDVISYISDTMKDLEKIDFSKVEVVVLEQGTNDRLQNVPAKTDFSFYENSYEGALNTVISVLKRKNPEVKVVVVSPGYVYDEDGSMPDNIEEYLAVGRAVTESNGGIFVDFYNNGGINEDNYSEYLFDGLHTNAAGNRILAELIYQAIK